MNTKRLRRIGYFVLGVVLALVSPIDEIILIAAVSTVLYRFVRRKYHVHQVLHNRTNRR